ncbi:MAG: Rnf-Nqr domain containing protein [Ruminiclostridium sp.]
MENRISLKDGFIKQNMVFMSGILIAPVIACSTSLMKSLAICFVFSLVTFSAIVICRFIPRTIVYTIRVILYSLVASILYIPSVLLAEALFGESLIASVGVYLPILVTNSLLLSKTETRFFHEPMKRMIPDVLCFIGGFDAACLVTGFVRELLADGRVFGYEIETLFTVPALETTFGGFLFVGIGAGVCRAIYNYRKKKAAEEPDEEEEALLEYAEDMGEFLVGKKHTEKEKIRIYKSAAKKAEDENSLLEMEFLSNKDILAEFEEIVALGKDISGENEEAKEEEK